MHEFFFKSEWFVIQLAVSRLKFITSAYPLKKLIAFERALMEIVAVSFHLATNLTTIVRCCELNLRKANAFVRHTFESRFNGERSVNYAAKLATVDAENVGHDLNKNRLFEVLKFETNDT